MAAKSVRKRKASPAAKKTPAAKPKEPYDPTKFTFMPSHELVQQCLPERGEDLDDDCVKRLRACFHADTLSRPEIHSAILQNKLSTSIVRGMDVNRLVDNLEAANARITNGNMADIEAMLYSQAMTLNTMFTDFVMTGQAQNQLKQYQVHMNLALKAQSQCRTTLEALGNIKNPPNLSFIRQQNNANNQQVNNGQQAPARVESESGSNKQLEHQHGERLDTGTTGTTIEDDSSMEAVGALDRTKDRGG